MFPYDREPLLVSCILLRGGQYAATRVHYLLGGAAAWPPRARAQRGESSGDPLRPSLLRKTFAAARTSRDGLAGAMIAIAVAVMMAYGSNRSSTSTATGTGSKRS
jgi:hypothetical protein